MIRFPICGWLINGKERQHTVPPIFLYINPTYLKNKGYSSPFFDIDGAYFTSYGDNGKSGKAPILQTWFKKGNIEIWYGLWYAKCPPMVTSIRINGKLFYEA